VKIGFLGFGEVASTLSKGLIKQGLEVSTSVTGRSPKTVLRAKNSRLNLFNSNKELACNCQILISTVVPKSAVNVAREIGDSFRGIYVDLNNVGPATIRKCLKYLPNSRFVDAAIIGSIRSGIDTPIIASGKYAPEFAKLNDFGMKIEVIGDEVGQASSIKLLRSSYSKGLAALLFETLMAAYKLNLDEKVLEYISRTECPDFKVKSESRIISSAYHSKRRSQEMEEIIQFLSNFKETIMNQATLDFYEKLNINLDQFEKRPKSYMEIFNRFKK